MAFTRRSTIPGARQSRPSGAFPAQPPSGGWGRTGAEPPDRALMARVVDRDEAALGTLLDRYGAVALGLATRVCASGALGQEVVQEVFLSLWLRAGTFDPVRGSLPAYLFAAVHHRAVDVVRHEAALRRRDEADALLVPQANDEDVAEATWLRMRRGEVRSAVAQLPAAQREALELAYFGGLSYREVAHRLGIPEGTAKTRLRDGMIRLRCTLSHLEPAAPEHP